jgi:hypothetical protein
MLFMDEKIKTFGALLPRYCRAASLSGPPFIPAGALKRAPSNRSQDVMPEPAITPW